MNKFEIQGLDPGSGEAPSLEDRHSKRPRKRFNTYQVMFIGGALRCTRASADRALRVWAQCGVAQFLGSKRLRDGSCFHEHLPIQGRFRPWLGNARHPSSRGSCPH